MSKKPDRAAPVELDPPADALEAQSAIEIMRAWIADGHLHLTFQPETFTHDVSEWGRMLADVTHHIARAVALSSDLTEREALTIVAEAYERGVSGASTVATGRVGGRTKH
jgi:hypothetical protein